MESVEHKNEKATRARNRTSKQEMCNRKKLKYNLVKTRKKKERKRNGKSGRARKSERSSEKVVVLAEQKTRNECRSGVKRTWHELREEDEPHREGSKIGTRWLERRRMRNIERDRGTYAVGIARNRNKESSGKGRSGFELEELSFRYTRCASMEKTRRQREKERERESDKKRRKSGVKKKSEDTDKRRAREREEKTGSGRISSQ